jgi:S-DNA-T family DNA segregation ATPase FtsK/SpoIIIE
MTNTTFYRPVRNYPDPLPTESIKIDSPPQQPAKQEGMAAFLQLLYPLSGVLITVVMLSSFNHGGTMSPLLLIAEVAVIPLSVGVMFLSNFLQRRSEKQRVRAAHARYRSELADRQRLLDDVKKAQQQRNGRLHPDLSVLNAVVTQRQNLWERRPIDDDFLQIRVGLAPVQLCRPLDFQEDRKVDYVPELLQEARDLVMRNTAIDNQPIVISLRTLGTLAVTGARSVTRTLVRAMLCQIIAFHAPTEVRIVACFPAESASEWEWLKWLPHTRRLRQVLTEHKYAPEPLCLLAETIADVQELLTTQIKPELERRGKLSQDTRENVTGQSQMVPHLVLVLDGFTPGGALAQVAGLEDILRDSARLGVTVLCLVDHPSQEPSTIRARLTLSSTFGGTQLSYEEMASGGADIEFITPDVADPKMCELMARRLTPLSLIDMDTPLDFSRNVRLLELLNVPVLDTLQVSEHWQPRVEKQLLRVPFGRQKNGTLELDLKEMASDGFGPHGLVVGATGSGKSELLRTIVTSLALTHDPHMVNFVLVDFKAGAAFADFAALPHVAGIITNLENDPLLINRMYASLLGEQQRRQTMLSNAGNLGNIKQYQAKWRKNPRMEPMPYLLIIVDEFAQLIANHEEFLALFTKFGQVGRSLGMHMLLSTQRVDEGRIRALEGHLRYRICLRTFKPEESSAVIGKPDAYYLPPSPGSGYFKVDEDIYTAFKTALISTPYVPATQQQVDPATLIRAFSRTGKLTSYRQGSGALAATASEESRTEMAVVIERITQSPAPSGGWHVHPVWQPPLKEMIPLQEVFTQYGRSDLGGGHWDMPAPFGPLCIPIGMLDRPVEQVQEPVVLDFSGVGGHLVVVGAPQSGKSTLLRTLITSLMVTHTPRNVQLYCIDLGGGLLRVFDGAPHIGAVCGRSDRDKTRRVLRRIRQIIVEREQLFAEQGIDSMATYRLRRHKGELASEAFGDVFLVIDNLAQLQSDFEASDPEIINDITSLVATGLTYGVHVIIAANQWIEIRPRMRSNIGTRLELRLNDPGDSDIDRKQSANIPPDAPGRGLHQSKLFFQAAWPLLKGSNPSDSVQQALEALVQRTRSAWKGRRAPQILVLPQEVKWEELAKPTGLEPAGIPIGLDELHLDPQVPVYVDLIGSEPHFLILGDRECGKTTLLRTWIRGIEQRYSPEQVQFALIDYRKTLLDARASANVFAYAFTPEQVKECVSNLKTKLEERIAKSMALPAEQLRNPQPWDGVHYFLFVDDYETVATPAPQTGNPLNPLEGLLQSAREIGFHLVLARRITEFGRTNYDNIFRGIKNMEGPGLIMRGDPIEGRQVLHKQTASDTLPDGRGYLVRRGYPPTLVQVAYTTVQ